MAAYSLCPIMDKKKMKENHLPFKHYYVYNGRAVEPEGGMSVVDFLNDYAKHELDR